MHKRMLDAGVKTMPAKDRFHEAVRNALIKEGWKVTHDPYTLKYGVRDQHIDLGAEALVAAEKGAQNCGWNQIIFRRFTDAGFA